MTDEKNSGYAKTENYYNKYGSWYDQERMTGYYAFINQREIDIVKKYGQGKDVLEIGCGTGIILNEVSKFTRSANGVDLSPGMIKQARAKSLNVQVANAKSLPFEDDQFDLVYSFKVLAHIPEIDEVMKEMTRVVKNDGLLVLEFYNPYSLKRLANFIYNRLKKRDVYLRYDSLKKIKSYLPADWKIIDYYGIKILSLGRMISASKFFVGLEKLLSKSFLKKLGGYSVVVLKKKND